MSEKIIQMNIADAVEDYSCSFGANKNLYRVNPVLQDGLKPGRRRLYYSWWLLEKKPSDTRKETLNKLKYYKTSKITSDTMGIHPHSTSANEDLLAKEGQPWLNNVMAITPQGSFGNLRGDEAAAGRYIMAKMSEYMIDCFFSDFERYSVPMKLAYDGETYEPEFLPAKYPHILFNPQFSGIGYSIASNIPPFNVAEVLKATIKLIEDPTSTVYLIPDSPSGCDILDTGKFKEINKTGQSSLTMRATAVIDNIKNTITFTSIPLQTSTQQIINNIIEMMKKREFDDDIVDIKDSTVKGDVKLIIELKRDANPDKVLNKLYKKKTGLKSTFPVGITIIDDYEIYNYGVKDLLLEWIEYRKDIVRSLFLNSLQYYLEKQHMNEVLLMVFSKDNIDTTIKIAKNSSSRKDAIEKFMKQYKITSLQAETIADMHVYNFTKDQYETYKKNKVTYANKINELNESLDGDKPINTFIIKQLEEGIKKWGSPRKSKVVKDDNTDKKDIPDTEHLLGISTNGFIKKVSKDKNSSIGSVGKTSGNLTVVPVNNRDDIIAVDTFGNVSKIAVSSIPNMKFEEIGVEVGRYFTVKEQIIGFMKMPDKKILKKADENVCILFVTKRGLAKKVALTEFSKITDFKPGITLNLGDEVASVLFVMDNTAKDIIIATDKGDGIRLSINDIKLSSRAAKGQPQIKLKKDEVVVNASRINPDKNLLLYVTSSGRIKLTDIKYFPTMTRNASPLSLITLTASETLVGVSAVSRKDVVMIYKKIGEPEQLLLKDLKVSSRVAKAEKIIKTPKGDSVVAYKVFQ